MVENRGEACWGACGGSTGYCPNFCGADGMCCKKGQGIVHGCDENTSDTDYPTCGSGGSKWHHLARGVPRGKETVAQLFSLPENPVSNIKQIYPHTLYNNKTLGILKIKR